METAVLKARPEEFLVVEASILSRHSNQIDAPFTYARLRKSGITTFEAVKLIARHFNIAENQILYAGLKDEDGLTEQTIALAAKADQSAIDSFNLRHASNRQHFAELRHDGMGHEPLKIGRLNGNNFRLVVRNLSSSFVERITVGGTYVIYFLNYYDVQRFGVPTGPKTTHLIGEALLHGDFKRAMGYLKEAKTPESAQALQFSGDPQDFFGSLEPRVIAFFKSSYSSHLWNTRLANLVEQCCGTEVYRHDCEDIPFIFSRKQETIISVLNKHRTLEHIRYHGDSSTNGTPGFRSTVVQTQIICNSVAADEMSPRAYKCDLAFFLPSGTYATMCIKQFVNLLDIIGSS